MEKPKLFGMRVDAKSSVPVYEQIKRAVKLAVLSGVLTEDGRLPSIRELALALKVNPNTIMKSYYQLEVEGFIYSRPGTGYFVRLDSDRVAKQSRALFSQLTEDYISRAADLGFSSQDIKEEIALRIPSEGGRESEED
jgi:GntR family transcriptional regulator